MQAGIDLNHIFSDGVRSIETYIMFRIKQETLRLTPELKAKNRTPINLSIGAPVKEPPFFVKNALIKALDEQGYHLYSTPKGESFFLEAAAARMKNRFGVEVDPKTEICSLIGSKEGLANVFRCLVNQRYENKQKDIILIPDPGYASYQEQIKVLGGLSYPIPLNAENNYMPDLEQVMKSLQSDGYSSKNIKAVVINYPSNPLGASATREYLKQVVNFAKSRKILLISDLAYADVYFEGEEPPASILEIEGSKDIAVEFHSLSKPYSMTGWRIGWVCGNKDAVGAIAKLKSTVDTGIFKAVQRAASEILISEEGDNYIKECNKEFQVKQQIMVKGFKELGWDMDNLLIPKATFYLWLPIPQRYSNSEAFTQNLLEKSGIVAVPGSGFGKYGEGFFRMSLVSSDENLHEVIDRMKQDGFYFK